MKRTLVYSIVLVLSCSVGLAADRQPGQSDLAVFKFDAMQFVVKAVDLDVHALRQFSQRGQRILKDIHLRLPTRERIGCIGKLHAAALVKQQQQRCALRLAR